MARRHWAVLLSLVTLVGSSGGATAAGAPATGERPTTLAGTTIVEAQRSGSLLVRLPRAATFDVPGTGPSSSLDISGKGRMVGFALVAAGSDTRRVIITGGRAVDDRGRPFTSAITHTDAVPLGAPRWTLPAGDYRLYVVTDGGPARVALRLKGLTGTTRVRPVRSAVAGVERPEPRGLPQMTQSAGALGELDGPGVLLSLATTEHPVSVTQVFESCVYAGDRAAGASFGPGCPGADSDGMFVLTNPNPERSAYAHVAGTLYTGGDPLPIAQGYSLTNVGLNDHVEYTALWLTF